MTTLEKVFSLLKTTNKGDYVIEREIGLKRGCIANWRLDRGNPSADALTKIADYFNVSVDYLLGRTDEPTQLKQSNISVRPTTALSTELVELAQDERFIDIAKLYKALPAERREQVLGLIQGIAVGLGLNIQQILKR